jgi:cysteinyl-tRNA synthetase
MKKLDIREAEITKEMYEEAKKIENIHSELKKLDCRTEEFRKLNNKVIEMEDKFEEEVCDDFLTLEIVNEYERRERKENKQVKTVTSWEVERKESTEMPFDKSFDGELCHATGYVVKDEYGEWWNEYVSSEGILCYGR